MSDIQTTVVNAIHEFCDVEDAEITGETNLVDDLALDSIDFLDVVYEIDREYDVKLPLEKWMAEINGGERSTDHFFVLSNFVARIQEIIDATHGG